MQDKPALPDSKRMAHNRPHVSMSIVLPSTLSIDLDLEEWASVLQANDFFVEIARNLDHFIRKPILLKDDGPPAPKGVTTVQMMNAEAAAVCDKAIAREYLFQRDGKWHFSTF